MRNARDLPVGGHETIIWQGQHGFAGFQIAYHPEIVFASKNGVTLLRLPYPRDDAVQRLIAIEKARSFIMGYALGDSVRSTRGQEPDGEGVYTGRRWWEPGG